MKTASTALKAHLQGNPTTVAFLWKVKRTDGVILGFTSFNADIIYDDASGDGPITYLAKTGFLTTAIAGKSDLSVDNSEATGFLDSSAITATDIRATRYDDALITLMLVNWNDLTMGHAIIRSGTLGIVKIGDPGRGAFRAELRGLSNKLSATLGSAMGPLCRAEFGSGLNGIDMNSKWLCKIDVVPLQQTTTIFDVPSSIQIRMVSPPALIPAPLPQTSFYAPANFFNEGLVTFTSGVLNGLKFEIKKFLTGAGMTDHSTFQFFQPMKQLPSPGDSLIFEPGCDKTLAKCQYYNNVVNRRAEDFIPGMDRFLDVPGVAPGA